MRTFDIRRFRMRTVMEPTGVRFEPGRDHEFFIRLLQKAAWRWLSWCGCLHDVLAPRNVVEIGRVQESDVLKAIRRQLDEYMRYNPNERPTDVVIGGDVLDELVGHMTNNIVTFTINSPGFERKIQDRHGRYLTQFTVFGMRVTAVPWFTGVLVLPTSAPLWRNVEQASYQAFREKIHRAY